MNLRWKLIHTGLLLAIVPMFLEMLFLVGLNGLVIQAEAEAKDRTHSREVISKTDAVIRCVRSGWLWLLQSAATGDISYLKYYDRDTKNMSNLFLEIGKLVKDDAEHLKRLNDLQSTCEGIKGGLDKLRAALYESFSNPDLDETQRLLVFLSLKKEEYRMRRLLTDLTENATSFLEFELARHKSTPESEAATRNQIKLLLAVGFVFNILLAAGLAAWFSRSVASRVNTIRENSLRLGRGESLLPPVSGADEIGQLDSLFHSMADALVESSQKERAILDNALDVICSVTAAGRFESINPAVESVWQRHASDLFGVHLSEIIAKADRQRTEAALKEIVNSRSEGKFENRIIKGDSTTAHMLWSVRWNQADKVLFCVAHDISKPKEFERMKQEFMSVFSEDVRKPLDEMRNLLSQFAVEKFGSVSASGKERVAATQKDVDRVGMLINDMLDLDQMDQGGFAIDCASTDSQKVCNAAIGSVQGLLDKKKIAITGAAVPAVPLNADQNRLVQVLVNLLSNAIKFSSEGAEIELLVVDTDKAIEFSVKDHGPGIPESAQSLIFGKFSQTEEGRKRGGSGLGLAISKAIVESHGGEIGFESKVAKGTRFWFKIPH